MLEYEPLLGLVYVEGADEKGPGTRLFALNVEQAGQLLAGLQANGFKAHIERSTCETNGSQEEPIVFVSLPNSEMRTTLDARLAAWRIRPQDRKDELHIQPPLRTSQTKPKRRAGDPDIAWDIA